MTKLNQLSKSYAAIEVSSLDFLYQEKKTFEPYTFLARMRSIFILITTFLARMRSIFILITTSLLGCGPYSF